MAQLTALALLNRVLRGLRRDAFADTSTTDSYHLLLLQFLNSVKEEYEDRWDWHALRETVTVTIATSQVEYTLTEAADADVDVSERSRLLYEKQNLQDAAGYGDACVVSSSYTPGSQPQAFDVTDGTEFRLTEIGPEQMERLHFTDNNETNKPTHFALYRDANSMLMKVWPTPSGARTWKMRFVIPQASIPSTLMTSYQLSIDSRSVWTRALHKLCEERGEDSGRPLSSLDDEAQTAIFLALDRERLPYTDNTGFPV